MGSAQQFHIAKITVFLGLLLLHVPRVVLADDLQNRVSYWEKQAFHCTENGLDFPSKQRTPGCRSAIMSLISAGDQVSPAGSVKWIPLSVRTVWTL